MNLTKRDAAAVALVAVSLGSVAGAVTVPARAAAAVEQATAARDAAVIERDQAVQTADGDYRQAQAVADAEHDRAVAAARGDREGEYQAAITDRDAAVADLGKVKDPSRESVRERGDEYAEDCSRLERSNPELVWPWNVAGVDFADKGRCREAGDELIAADLAKAKEDVAERRKALTAVRDENAKTVAAIDKAAGPAIEQASQTRGQSLAQAQAQRDAAVQAAENNAAPVIASADEDIAAGESSHTGTLAALWAAAVAALAGAVWLGRGRLAQVPVRRAGGALTAAAVWLVQGWARAATWAVQQRRGGRLGRAFESATISGLQAGAFAPAELLKGSAMSHGWDTSKPQKAVSGVRIAVLVSVLTMAGMAIATRLGAPAEATVAETGMVGASYFLAHLVPLSWVVFGGPVAAVAAAGVGHALPLDAPMPPPAAPGAAVADLGPDAPGDVLVRSLPTAEQTRWGHMIAPAERRQIRGGHQYTWTLPPGLPATVVNRERLLSNASALGLRPRVSERSGQRVVVDVFDTDELPPVKWKAERRTNFRDAVPVGESVTGNDVKVNLTGERVAIIAKSGHGKTFLARMLALWAAQDPAVDLRVADLKGDSHLAMLRGCANQWETGEDLDAARAMIRGVAEEVERRNVWAGKDPEGRQPIDVFGPLVLFVDEVDVVAKKEKDTLTDITRRCRSAGVTLILATQETSKESLPTVALQNCTTRFVGQFDMGDYPRHMMGVPDGTDTSGLELGEWALKAKDRSGWSIVTAALVDDPEARERAAEAARVRAETMPVVAQDVLPEAAEAEERDPAELAAEGLRIGFGERTSLTLEEARAVLGDDKLTVLLDALPAGNNGRHDRVKRNGVPVAGVRKERIDRFLNL